MAGRFSVESVFKAVDRVTAPVSRMQTRISRFTQGVSRGLRTVNRQMGRMLTSMRRGLTRVAKFGGAMLAIGSAAVVTALNRTANAADELVKQSRRLQFPVEELQEWKFVAEQSGVSTELLDKSLGSFTKRLGEAKNGMGPMVAGLKDVNPELLRQLQSTENVADAFELYIDALRETETATGRAVLANAAFSRSGLNMADIAENSSAAIAALRKEQRENGIITMEQAEAAEEYGDAVNSLRRALKGLIDGVMLPMMPLVTEQLRNWREWIVLNKELIQTRVLEFAQQLRERIKDLVAALIEFNHEYDLPTRLGEGLDMLGKFARFLAEHGVRILKVVAGVVALSVALQTLGAILTVVNLIMAANPIGLIVLGIAALIAAVAAAIRWWRELRDMLYSLGPSFDLLIAAVGFLAGPIGALVAMAAIVIRNWEPLSAFFSGLWGGITDTFANAMKWIEEKLASFLGFVDRIKAGAASVRGFFGSDDGSESAASGGGGDAGQMVTPQERVARSIEERSTTSTAEVTIRDDTGRAEQTGGTLGQGVRLQSSGVF